MRCASAVCCVCLVVVGLWRAAPASAQPPDILRNFRLIPSRSELNVTGGFAGVNQSYHLFGRFGLVTGFDSGPSPDSPLPVLMPYAEFVDVNVFALLNNPVVFAPLIPLEQFIDLEQLDGTFQPGIPTRYMFHGEDAQGRGFNLAGIQRGPLLYLRGESEPMCCDFFDYEIRALAHLAPYADFNLDGMVDRDDAATIMANIGLLAGATFEQGDADGDGDVDGDDFLTWQMSIGPSVDLNVFAEAASGPLAIPEPASFALALSAAVMLAVGRRRAR